MITDTVRRFVSDRLRNAGVHVNGQSRSDIQVRDDRFFRRALLHGSLGFGESYMDAWWDCEDLPGLLTRVIAASVDEHRTWHDTWLALRARLSNDQRGRRVYDVAKRHYDLDIELFEAMLGPKLIYSCGYWPEARTLDEAQDAKLDLVFRKLGLQSGMRVLDIGCGWGEALHRAATRHGVEGVGITISESQAAAARERCKGLPVEFRVADYRLMNEPFDRIWSIGMFEHVGESNYAEYFDVVRRCLGSEGLFLLHTIGSNVSTRHTDPWIEKYIFPNSMLPSALQISRHVEGRFVIEDWHNFGNDYARTLSEWRARFDAAWPRLRHRYDERFQRMWHFYLDASRASFLCRRLQLWQLVLSPNGVQGGYRAPR
jgi:cyclopropane-fatty-acyl-phospholipid synthase